MYARVRVCVRMFVRVRVYVCVRAFACVCWYVCVCMHTCVCACVCEYMKSTWRTTMLGRGGGKMWVMLHKFVKNVAEEGCGRFAC